MTRWTLCFGLYERQVTIISSNFYHRFVWVIVYNPRLLTPLLSVLSFQGSDTDGIGTSRMDNEVHYSLLTNKMHLLESSPLVVNCLLLEEGVMPQLETLSSSLLLPFQKVRHIMCIRICHLVSRLMIPLQMMVMGATVAMAGVECYLASLNRPLKRVI